MTNAEPNLPCHSALGVASSMPSPVPAVVFAVAGACFLVLVALSSNPGERIKRGTPPICFSIAADGRFGGALGLGVALQWPRKWAIAFVGVACSA